MEPFIAEIIMFGGNFAPRGWAFCNGQLLSINENQALFSLLGTTYGGDGRTTFALPDLRGRAAIHAGNGPGLTDRRLGSKGGSETNNLNVNQLPSHNHTASGDLKVMNGAGDETNPGGGHLASASTDLYASGSNATSAANSVNVSVGNTGGGQAVNNMQPWLAVNYIIALTGIFPSRN